MLHGVLLDKLLDDDSPYALCQGRPQRLRELVEMSLDTILAGIPAGTLKADESGLKWVAHFCLAESIPFIRPMVVSEKDKTRERFMFAMLLCFCARHMNPRSKKRFSDNGKILSLIHI